MCTEIKLLNKSDFIVIYLMYTYTQFTASADGQHATMYIDVTLNPQPTFLRFSTIVYN